MIEKLSKYLDLKAEVEDLKKRLDDIGQLSAIRYDRPSVQSSETPGLDRIIVAREQAYTQINRSIVKMLEALVEAEVEIASVEDPDVRLILRLKFIDGLPMDEVARAAHMSRTNCYRKYSRWRRTHR